MLGGLFQSTNILMSRSQKSSNTNSDGNLKKSSSSILSTSKIEKYKFNYDDFGDVDHR